MSSLGRQPPGRPRLPPLLAPCGGEHSVTLSAGSKLSLPCLTVPLGHVACTSPSPCQIRMGALPPGHLLSPTHGRRASPVSSPMSTHPFPLPCHHAPALVPHPDHGITSHLFPFCVSSMHFSQSRVPETFFSKFNSGEACWRCVGPVLYCFFNFL